MITLKQLQSSLSTFGLAFSDGLLGFNGVLRLSTWTILGIALAPHLMALAVFALIFAVVIETTVYGKNITEEIQSPPPEVIVKRAIAERELEKLEDQKKSRFVTGYFEQQAYLETLLENKKQYSTDLSAFSKKTDSEIASDEIILTKRTLALKKELFIDFIQAEKKPTNYLDGYWNELTPRLLGDHHIIEKENLKKEIRNKVIVIKYMSTFIAIVSGIGQTLVTWGSLQMASPYLLPLLAPFGLTILFSPVSLIILSILGGAGFAYTMRNAIKDLVLTDWIKKIKDMLPELKIRQQDSTRVRGYKWTLYTFKLVLTALVIVGSVGITIIAFLAQGETFLQSVKKCVSYLINIRNLIINLIMTTLIVIMCLPNFIFNLMNIIRSLKIIGEKVVHLFEKIRFFFSSQHKPHEHSSNQLPHQPPRLVAKRILQFLNPFTLCLAIIDNFILIGHSLITGINSDAATSMSMQNSILSNALLEWITDYGYMGNAEEEHSHEEKHASCEQASHGQREEKHAAPLPSKKSSGHEHSHSHDKGFFLELIDKSLRYLGAGWDFMVGWPFENSYTWKQAKLKFFPIQSLPSAPATPFNEIKIEITQRIDRKIEKYFSKANIADEKKKNEILEDKATIKNTTSNKKMSSSSLIKHKIVAFNELKAKINKSNSCEEIKTSLNAAKCDKDSILTQHSCPSSAFFVGLPKSHLFLEKLSATLSSRSTSLRITSA
jgi:hypothetical protein